MRIESIECRRYNITMINGQQRAGALIAVHGSSGQVGWGEIAPLPKWSQESLEEALTELERKKEEILRIDWTAQNYFEHLKECVLLPSVSFGLESALTQLFCPLPEQEVETAALLMGTVEEIFEQAELYREQGYRSVKLKVSQLTFKEAKQVIDALKDHFHLRIDVNRAWNSVDSITFFAQFPRDTFDYVEEPMHDPHDLIGTIFPQPIAIDESYPENLSIEQLGQIPSLKALIYKPTMQGGMVGLVPLLEWAKPRNVQIVLSSSFETDIGLAHIAMIALRYHLSAPIGIGTLAFMTEQLGKVPLVISKGVLLVPSRIEALDPVTS